MQIKAYYSRDEDSTGGECLEQREILVVREGVPMELQTERRHQYPKDYEECVMWYNW